MENIFNITIETPVGYLELSSDLQYLLTVSFVKTMSPASDFQPDILKKSANQLVEYFNGTRNEFNLDLNPAGTDFQIKVWEHVKKVPFGKTVSYFDIAILSGSKKNTRAVGLANGKNPIPIIIPCHRVIGTNGKLTGYAGGLEIKKWLLQHELKYSKHSNLLF